MASSFLKCHVWTGESLSTASSTKDRYVALSSISHAALCNGYAKEGQEILATPKTPDARLFWILIFAKWVSCYILVMARMINTRQYCCWAMQTCHPISTRQKAPYYYIMTILRLFKIIPLLYFGRKQIRFLNFWYILAPLALFRAHEFVFAQTNSFKGWLNTAGCGSVNWMFCPLVIHNVPEREISRGWQIDGKESNTSWLSSWALHQVTLNCSNWTSCVAKQALVAVRQQLLAVIFIIMASLFDI